MSRFALFAALVLLPFLAGCDSGPPAPPFMETAKAGMIGMSKGETYICLGPPVKKLSEGSNELWSYAFGACGTNVTLSNGRVVEVDYNVLPPKKITPDYEAPTLEDACAHVPEVLGCVRWVRGK